MNENTNKTDRLYPLTQDLYEAIEKIIRSAYDNAASIVVPKCNVPDGFYRIPESGGDADDQASFKTNNMRDRVKDALSAALPASLTALALAFNAPGVAVVVLSGAGGIAGSFIQHAGTHDMRLSDLELKRLDLETLTDQDIEIKVKTDDDKKAELLSASLNDANAVCREMSEFEEKMKKRHDIAINREFGEWVQGFIVYVNKHPDDRKLQLMKDSLIDRLTEMKLYVYDEPVLDADGRPAVPFPDYLIDRSNGSKYEAVIKPAVYSDRALLARGEIL